MVAEPGPDSRTVLQRPRQEVSHERVQLNKNKPPEMCKSEDVTNEESSATGKSEKADIKKEAEKLEAEAKAWDERSGEEMHQHHRWAQATTVLQVSIALAAIALLTKRRWLEWGTLGLGGIGIVLGAAAWFHL